MNYRDVVNQTQYSTFKSAALARAPISSSLKDGVQLETTKVISSITKNVFLSRIRPNQPSEIIHSAAVDCSTGSIEHQCLGRTSRRVNPQKLFPQTLMDMLSQEEDPEVITWLPSGDAFIVRNWKKFSASVLPKYFNTTKLASFRSNLRLYGFRKIYEAPHTYLGAYQHDLFRRDFPELCRAIKRKGRRRIKNTADDIKLNENDVLCRGPFQHSGNVSFRQLVNANKALYASYEGNEERKTLLASDIVSFIRNQTPPGRFLEQNTVTGLWCDIGDQRACEKARRALRKRETIPSNEPLSPCNIIQQIPSSIAVTTDMDTDYSTSATSLDTTATIFAPRGQQNNIFAEEQQRNQSSTSTFTYPTLLSDAELEKIAQNVICS